jgi:hypothetical protein
LRAIGFELGALKRESLTGEALLVRPLGSVGGTV